MRVKNWEKFQHYKNRKPPWIRLYRDLLDDPEFFELSGDAVKHLLMFWLIASEDPEMKGELPAVKVLAFRLRTTVKKTESSIAELYHWLEYDASDMQADCPQHATPDQIRSEAESDQRQRQRQSAPARRGTYTDAFERFWSAYPRNENKRGAFKAFKAAMKTEDWPGLEAVIGIIESQKGSEQWTKDNGQFIPHPATWLNGGRWADSPREANQDINDYIAGLEEAEREEEIIDAECTEI